MSGHMKLYVCSHGPCLYIRCLFAVHKSLGTLHVAHLKAARGIHVNGGVLSCEAVLTAATSK